MIPADIDGPPGTAVKPGGQLDADGMFKARRDHGQSRADRDVVRVVNFLLGSDPGRGPAALFENLVDNRRGSLELRVDAAQGRRILGPPASA